MHRALFVLLLGLVATPAAFGQSTAFAVRWKLRSSDLWPPVISGEHLLLRNGDTVSAFSLSSGRLIWSRRVLNQQAGEASMAASERYVFLLTRTGMETLELASGRTLARRSLVEPTGLIYNKNGSLYLASAAGLWRLDESGAKVIQRVSEFIGELRGADGDYVALYRQVAGSDRKSSPKRLTIVNLRTGKIAFEFKLLPDGTHRVARMGGGRIAFIDFTQRQVDGSNRRRLYYTDADYLSGEKLRDVSLASKYTVATADTFWISAGGSGRVFLANHGQAGSASTLFAFDPEQKKTLWTRSGEVASMGLAIQDDRLWTGVVGKGGDTQLVAYNLDTGDVVARVPLEGAGVDSPVAAGQTLLVNTRRSLYALARAVPPQAVDQESTGSGTSAASAAGRWRLLRDRVAGYLIQVPESWIFDRQAMKKLGGLRFVIPFVRREFSGGQPVTIATVHILTWEAAGRDAQGLWKSVQDQRLRTNPSMRVLGLMQIPAPAGSGAPALQASYSFRNAKGEMVQMKSLCLISHGLAFELRGWVSSSAPVEIWQEVEGIFRGFVPKPPGTL